MVELFAALLAIVWLILPLLIWAGLAALRRKTEATNKLLGTIVEEQLLLRKEAAATRTAVEALLLEFKEARAIAERNTGKTLTFLRNIDVESEHANELLEWIGRQGGAPEAEPDAVIEARGE